jgi:hypothetical protein
MNQRASTSRVRLLPVPPRLNAVRRGFCAAALHLSNEVLSEPTVIQSAAVWQVSVTYTRYALRRMEQRALIESGTRPLVPPPGTKSALLSPGPIQDVDLIALAANVGATRWLEAAARAGI